MEAANEPPQIQFAFIGMTRGLDYVAEVRHCGSWTYAVGAPD
jgi:hypothetical protein